MSTIILADRVQETSTTTGTGTLDLDGAVTGYQGFVAGAGDTSYIPYTIVGQAGGGAAGEWETGYGTVTDAATDTLSRTVVEASSNAGSLVNFSAGTKDVFITAHSAVLTNAMEVIGVYDPSAVANLDIDISGYESVEIKGWLAPATDTQSVCLRFSNDAGSSFHSGASDYDYGLHYSYDGVHSFLVDAAETYIRASINCGNASGEQVNFCYTITSCDTSSSKTAVSGQIVQRNDGGFTCNVQSAGFVNVASEVNDAVRLFFTSGNIASGRVVAYGYRDNSSNIAPANVTRAMDVIGTYDPSAVANLDIDISGYDSIELIGWLTVSTDDANVHGRFSNDGGSTFRAGASDYTRTYMHVNDTGAYADHGDATADHCSLVLATGNAAGEDSAFHAKIIGAYTASVKTRLIGHSGVVNGTPNFQGVRTSNKVNTAEINDAVQLVATAGTFTGHVVAYGYKTAATAAAPHVQVVAVQTQTPSAVSEVDFDISGYESVEFVGSLKPSADGVKLEMLASNDAGATFETGASYYRWDRVWSIIGSQGTSQDEADDSIVIGGDYGNDTGESVSFKAKVISPAESGLKTSVTYETIGLQTTGLYVRGDGMGLVDTEEVNDAIRLKFDSGNMTGRITMYGYPAA